MVVFKVLVAIFVFPFPLELFNLIGQQAQGSEIMGFPIDEDAFLNILIALLGIGEHLLEMLVKMLVMLTVLAEAFLHLLILLEDNPAELQTLFSVFLSFGGKEEGVTAMLEGITDVVQLTDSSRVLSLQGRKVYTGSISDKRRRQALKGLNEFGISGNFHIHFLHDLDS